MAHSQNFSATARAIAILAAFVIVVAGMRAAETVLVPFFLSGFIAVICAPPMFWMQRKGLPTIAALSIVILAVLTIGGFMGALIGNSINDFSQQLPTYQVRLQDEFAGLFVWLSQMGFDIFDKQVFDYFDPGAAMRLVATTLASFGGVLTNAFLILLTVVFILLEASSFPAKLQTIFDDPNESLGRFDEVLENIKRYMVIKSVVSLLTGFCVAISLWIIGVDYPLLWGVLAFLLNFVPNIGSIIAAVPAVLLAVVQLGTLPAIATAIVYFVVNIVVGNVIEPRFMGRGLGLSTLVVFLSLVFWGWVLGPVGMLLSVPLTMTVKIALESSDEAHWLAVLLGQPVQKKKASVSEP